MTNTLDEALDMFESQTPEQRERFVVDNDQKAGWAMRKLRVIRMAKKANADMALEEIQRIQKWLEDANSRSDNDEVYFHDVLVNYAKSQRELSDRKTVALPHGKISSRQGQPKWDVDLDKFINWAQDNKRDDLLRFKVEADMLAIKESLFGNPDLGNVAVTSDGEIVDGIVIESTPTTYKIDVEL